MLMQGAYSLGVVTHITHAAHMCPPTTPQMNKINWYFEYVVLF